MLLRSDTLKNVSAVLIIMALIIAGLVLGRDILIPLALATILSFILAPIVRWLTKIRIPRSAAVVMAVVGMLAIIIGGSTVLSQQLLSLAADLGNYRSNLAEKYRVLTNSEGERGVISRAAEAVDAITEELEKPAARTPAGTPPPVPAIDAPIASSTAKSSQAAPLPPAEPETPLDILGQLGAVAEPLAVAGLTVLLTLFLLLQYKDLRDRVVRVLGTDNMTGTTSAMSDAGSRLSKLFLMQAMLNAMFGTFIGMALWIIGVPNPILWGVVAAIMRFVPFIGSLLAAVPPILIAAAVDPGWTMAIATLMLFVIGEPFMGHVVEPLILGKHAGISPFAMVASASFWTLVWGPIGLILAAPLTLALVVLGRYVPGLEFFTVMLGDDRALAPPEEFYHRLLSKDSLAGAELLEEHESDNSPLEITDRVVLPALRLAIQDEKRGRLDRAQTDELRQTVAATSELFAEVVADAMPVAPQTGDRAIILPARGALDMAAAEFLARLLSQTSGAEVHALTSSAGLSGLNEARGEAERLGAKTIILVTVGGLDRKHLTLIARRAEREFPDFRRIVFDFGRQTGADATQGGVDTGSTTCVSAQELSHILKIPRTQSAQAEPVPVAQAV